MSALGQKRTLQCILVMSALPPKADIGTQPRNVRFVPTADSVTWSERRRRAIAADTPCTALKCSVGLLDSDDEDRRAWLEICPISHVVRDNWRIDRHEDFLFAVFVFQRQRPTLDGGADLLDIRVRHHALRPEIPRVVSFSGSTHCLRKNVYFQRT